MILIFATLDIDLASTKFWLRNSIRGDEKYKTKGFIKNFICKIFTIVSTYESLIELYQMTLNVE